MSAERPKHYLPFHTRTGQHNILNKNDYTEVMQNCTVILQWEKILKIYKINAVILSNKKVILFSMTSRLTYDSQSPKTEGGLCVMMSLGPETHCSRALQGTVGVWRQGMCHSQGTERRGMGAWWDWRGQWPWAMAARDLQQDVSCFKCMGVGGHQLGLLSWENCICGYCQGCYTGNGGCPSALASL